MAKKSSDLTKYVVYSYDAKLDKKTYHQSYDDSSKAQEHRKALLKLYGKNIQVGIDERHGRFKSSVMKCLSILKERRNG